MTVQVIISFFILYQVSGLPVSKTTPTKNVNRPDEQSNLFEGDMNFPPSSARGVFKLGDAVAWPNGIVPYEIASGFEPEHEQLIRSTMVKMENALAVNNALCIDFRPRTSSDQYYITIRNGDGCWSYVGRNTEWGTNQERTVSLESNGCMSTGIIMHELLHTLGFYHEQSRPDRDDYVTVDYQNIESGEEHNFEKYDNTYVHTFNTPYDYESVMHYRKNAFAIDSGSFTIIPNDPNAQIGQRVFMSEIDIAEVQIVYKCLPHGTVPSISTTKTTSTYASTLTTDDRMYVRPYAETSDYYYETIPIVVDRSGIYSIQSVSDMDTRGYIYEGVFNPTNPSVNLYEDDDDTAGNSQFKLTVHLQAGLTYTLVISTYASRVTGSFSLLTVGPGNAQYSTSGASVRTTRLPSPPTTTTQSAIVNSYYSYALTSSSSRFSRDKTDGSLYYYDPIIVRVTTSGIYNFQSSGSLDAYGYLYQSNFDSSSVFDNLLMSDDDGAGSSQFQLSTYLQSGIKYILIYTTYQPLTTGQFRIIASGPDNVSMI